MDWLRNRRGEQQYQKAMDVTTDETNDPSYSVSRIRFNNSRNRIQMVRVHLEPSHFLLGDYGRHQVIASIERGESWITIHQIGVNWRKGVEIKIVTVNDKGYLRTDENEVEEDNLGGLPEF